MPKGNKQRITDEEKEQKRIEKAEKFRELTIKRMGKLRDVGKTIIPLATYPHNEQDKQDILNAIQAMKDEIEKAFIEKKHIVKSLFKFSE